MSNNVTHPRHYTSHPSGIECIEITRHHNFNIGNAIKYLWRAGLKEEQGKTNKEKQIEDLNKAIWYIQDYIKNTLLASSNNNKEEVPLNHNKCSCGSHKNCNGNKGCDIGLNIKEETEEPLLISTLISLLD